MTKPVPDWRRCPRCNQPEEYCGCLLDATVAIRRGPTRVSLVSGTHWLPERAVISHLRDPKITYQNDVARLEEENRVLQWENDKLRKDNKWLTNEAHRLLGYLNDA